MKKKILILTSLFFLLDFVSKILVSSYLKLNATIPLIKNFFSITYVLNDGAAFSLLSGKRYLFIILGVIFIGYLIFSILKENVNRYQVIYYSLLLSGVLGNLVDRIVRGFVVDFLDFQILNYNAPIFNLADTFIVISVLLILFETLKKEGLWN